MKFYGAGGKHPPPDLHPLKKPSPYRVKGQQPHPYFSLIGEKISKILGHRYV